MPWKVLCSSDISSDIQEEHCEHTEYAGVRHFSYHLTCKGGSVGIESMRGWGSGQRGAFEIQKEIALILNRFLKKVFIGHMSFFRADGTPVRDFWWHLLWVSKQEWILPYLLVFAEANVMYIPPRSTSGATRADFLAASGAAGHWYWIRYCELVNN